MKEKIFMGCAGLLAAVTISIGETVTATSAPFQFPEAVKIKNGAYLANAPYFRYSGFFPGKGIATIAWRVPAGMKAEKGAITIYTLLGREVQTFPIDARQGVLNWKVTENCVANGVYFARLRFGTHKSNLKIVLFK